ncbi:uncharacterized protein LOC141855625 [Brevipalpus obovatus]|uniref:uncharacterized protein LOC141855625 n=1 Tax=Brevipalpus obovatus TaxID=246614 RepID=UPI003D9E5D15
MVETRNEGVIIYACGSDIESLPLTSSPMSSPVYYLDNSLINSSGHSVCFDSSENDRPRDSSESSLNLYDVASTVQLSPVSDDYSENHHHHNSDQYRASKLKRGRPKLETISTLINSSIDEVSAIKCNICKRTFPREKSLQAHIRIHTGERPYFCDFPNCGRRFAQSGQLRTHQRLHTGEKPFVCNYEGCHNRFTHANRRCSDHPESGVSRDRCNSPPILRCISAMTNANQEIVDWLNGYYRTVKRQAGKRLRDCSIQALTPRRLDMDALLNDSFSSKNELIEETAMPIWKKKRAALELQARENANNQENSAKRIKLEDSIHEVKPLTPPEVESHLPEQSVKHQQKSGPDEKKPVKMEQKPSIDLKQEPHPPLRHENFQKILPVSVKDENEKLLGALALIEFANRPVINSNTRYTSIKAEPFYKN